MRRALKLFVGALVIVVLAAGGFVAWYVFSDRAPAKPALSGSEPVKGGPATPVGTWHVVRRSDVYVGYRIKELFGDSVLKHTVVGRTPAVAGTLTVAKTRVAKVAVSADLRQLASDRAARDTYIEDHGLETDRFPNGRFTLTAPIALPSGVARGQKVHARATGRMLLHGVTRPVTFDLDARWDGPTIEVVGTAPIVLKDFGITPPHTVIADVDDHGSMEVDLVFEPGAR